MKMKWSFSSLESQEPAYDRIAENADEDSSSKWEIEKNFNTQPSRRTMLSSNYPWMISTIGLTLAIIVLLYKDNTRTSFETGFATDLGRSYSKTPQTNSAIG